MTDTIKLWPKRKEVDKNTEKLVTPKQSDIRKFVNFGLMQINLKETLQPGCRLNFTGQAQGAITVDTIEDIEGRDVGNDRVFRLRGRTDKGITVIATIWFLPAENQTESERTAIFFDPNQITPPSSEEKPKIETAIRFADGFENVRDNFTTGNIMELRLQSSSGWTARTVSVLTKTKDSKTGKITFKVMGDNKLATVILDSNQPTESKIIFLED